MTPDTTRFARLAATAVALFLAASCASDGPTASDADTSSDADVSAIVADLNDYWSEADDELGFEYAPVPDSRVTTGTDGITCDAEPIDPVEIEGNAFVDPSCEEGITVAYDPAYVDLSLPQAEATMAHEWGHVIQAQATDVDISQDPSGLPIDAELQADCFAGAWSAERAESDIEQLRVNTAQAADRGDVDVDDPDAHGTAVERTTAFDIGLDGGPGACVDELIDALPE